jgi:hypothetical protein
MAVRQADNTLIDRMITERDHLRVLEADLRKHGDNEEANVIKRALREFALPAFTSVANKAGRAH